MIIFHVTTNCPNHPALVSAVNNLCNVLEANFAPCSFEIGTVNNRLTSWFTAAGVEGFDETLDMLAQWCAMVKASGGTYTREAVDDPDFVLA